MTSNVQTYNNIRHKRAGKSASRIKADRRSAIIFAAIIIIAAFLLVSMRSYAATLQHENNVLVADNEKIQAEIDSLNSQIVEATKVTKIEKIATEEYGMIYPTSENCVRISSDEENSQKLASVIRNGAYN